MALIKVLIIFVVILALLNKRLPLYLAMIFGSLLMIVMFRLPLATAGQTALHTLTGWDVWSVNLAMYVISVLVYELDLRHRFEDAQRAMNGLMRDPRLNTSLAYMFSGLMQGPATVTICGGMVDTMAGEHLKTMKRRRSPPIFATFPRLWCRRLRASSWRAASAVFLVLVILYAFGTLVAGSSAAAAAFIPLAYTMIPNGGAFLLALLMSVSFASSQLSPTHICTAIISDYFGVTFFATVKKLLPLFLLTVLIACGYYMLLTAVF